VPDSTAGSTHSPKTSVSSEIEFCGIAPRLPRKISIKFHQVRRSSANDSMATLYRRRRGGSLARSLAQSICHRLIWFADGRALPARSICQRLGPAAFPKSRRPYSYPGNATSRIQSSAAAFLAAVKSRVDSAATSNLANRCFTGIAVRDAVAKMRNNAAKSYSSFLSFLSFHFFYLSISCLLFIIFASSSHIFLSLLMFLFYFYLYIIYYSYL